MAVILRNNGTFFGKIRIVTGKLLKIMVMY